MLSGHQEPLHLRQQRRPVQVHLAHDPPETLSGVHQERSMVHLAAFETVPRLPHEQQCAARMPSELAVFRGAKTGHIAGIRQVKTQHTLAYLVVRLVLGSGHTVAHRHPPASQCDW